jgi:L-lactate permease
MYAQNEDVRRVVASTRIAILGMLTGSRVGLVLAIVIGSALPGIMSAAAGMGIGAIIDNRGDRRVSKFHIVDPFDPTIRIDTRESSFR